HCDGQQIPALAGQRVVAEGSPEKLPSGGQKRHAYHAGDRRQRYSRAPAEETKRDRGKTKGETVGEIQHGPDPRVPNAGSSGRGGGHAREDSIHAGLCNQHRSRVWSGGPDSCSDYLAHATGRRPATYTMMLPCHNQTSQDSV